MIESRRPEVVARCCLGSMHLEGCEVDWSELLKTGGAITGTVLGIWNLIAASLTGVTIERRPANVLIANTGRRPVCVDVIGFIQPAQWEPRRACIELQSVEEIGLPRPIDPWRSVTYELDLRAHLESSFDPKARTYWFAHMENGAIATTVPWYRPYALWRVRRVVRAAHRDDPFFYR